MHIGDEMEIKEIPTLEQKQAFWAEQLPNFESKYWLPSHFEFLIFDMDQGNYVIKDDLDPSFEDDATEIWHRVNTGWAMWKKAIKFTEQQATPEGFVLVPKIITDEWMAVYVDPEVSKYCKEFEGLSFAVTEKDLPMIQEDFRRPIKAAHSRLMKVIEAQEQSHD